MQCPLRKPTWSSNSGKVMCHCNRVILILEAIFVGVILETDGVEVRRCHDNFLLGEQDDESPVYLIEIRGPSVEDVEEACDHVLYGRPEHPKEIQAKPIGAWAVVCAHVPKSRLHFFHSERLVEVCEASHRWKRWRKGKQRHGEARA